MSLWDLSESQVQSQTIAFVAASEDFRGIISPRMASNIHVALLHTVTGIVRSWSTMGLAIAPFCAGKQNNRTPKDLGLDSKVKQPNARLPKILPNCLDTKKCCLICLGLKNAFVEAFANQGSSNGGFVSLHTSVFIMLQVLGTALSVLNHSNCNKKTFSIGDAAIAKRIPGVSQSFSPCALR